MGTLALLYHIYSLNTQAQILASLEQSAQWQAGGQPTG